MTSYQQSLKPGDEVRHENHFSSPAYVIVTTPHGVLVEFGSSATVFWRWSDVVEPPAPKAKPGVMYTRVGTFNDRVRGVGLADGRIWDTLRVLALPFDPNIWTKVD